jgi:hypothetical protein
MELVFICVFLAWGAFLAFHTRELPSLFNESTQNMMALFSLIFFGCLLVPVTFAAADVPDATVIMQGLGQVVTALMLAVIMFVPKIYYVFIGEAHGDVSLTPPPENLPDKNFMASRQAAELAIVAKRVEAEYWMAAQPSQHNGNGNGNGNYSMPDQMPATRQPIKVRLPGVMPTFESDIRNESKDTSQDPASNNATTGLPVGSSSASPPMNQQPHMQMFSTFSSSTANKRLSSPSPRNVVRLLNGMELPVQNSTPTPVSPNFMTPVQLNSGSNSNIYPAAGPSEVPPHSDIPSV